MTLYRRIPPSLAALLALAVIASDVRPAAAAVPGRGAPADTLHAAATFDTVWTRIRDSYHDTLFVQGAWTEARERLRPEALDAATREELRAVLRDLLELIGESHFALIPGDIAEELDGSGEGAGQADGPPGDPGMEVRVVEGVLAVVRVDPGSPADRGGIRPGWVLEAVDGRDFEAPIEALGRLEGDAAVALGRMRVAMGAAARLRGPAGTVVRLRLRDGEARPLERDLELVEGPGEVVRVGNLPPLVARLEHSILQREDGCVGVIRLGVWMAPLARRFDEAVDQFRDCRGIVVDLRGNPGGLGGMVMGASGHFLDERVALGTMTSRAGEMRFVANPRRSDARGGPVEVFDGPLAILVDALSASTSEIFAAGMQGVGRARVFGEPTPGQALPSVVVRLPNGDLLQHAIADFTGPGGLRIEGRGVQPDERVEVTRRALLEEGDPVLAAALRWISGTGERPGPDGMEPMEEQR